MEADIVEEEVLDGNGWLLYNFLSRFVQRETIDGELDSILI